MTNHQLISAEAVRALPTVQLVDCRFRLGQHGAGIELYREGHIPGALYLDLDDDLSVVIGLVARILWRVVGER